MVKKLLLSVSIFCALMLIPATGWSQCPSSVGVTANRGTAICAGEEIIFTANPTGGSGYEYQWQINQNNVSGANSSTFKTTSLTNNQKVRVIVKSTTEGNDGCSIPSSEVPITVNPIRTVTAVIAANNSNICPGQTVNFTISSQSNIGSGSQYEWRVNGTSQGTSTTFPSNNLVAGDQVQLWVDSSVPCTDPILSNTISITEKPGTPAVPSDFTTSETAVCPGATQTFTVPNDPNASEYIWTYPSGWSGSSTTNSITITSGNSGSGTITVKAKNSCGTSEARSLAVSVKAGTPVTPGIISGTAQVCPGISQTFNIATVAGATSYEWTFPTGWTGSSTSTSITLTPTAGTAVNGNLSVTATNDCGNSSARTLAISVKSGTPDQPAAFKTGPATLCPGTEGTYSVPIVPGATQYIWTLPSGFSASNLTTTTPSLVVTAGTTASGNITVKATNDCGTSTERSMAISINAPKPVMTEEIAGSTGVCANTTSLSYSIPAIGNATIYEWTVTGTGWQITAGEGTNQITVTSGTMGGTISVIAKNSCGDSASKSITVGLNPPPPVMAGEISGPSNVCAGSIGNTYSIPTITGATSYTWTAPPGWSINGEQNSNTITVSAGSSDGNISVTAVNGCGSSTTRTFHVTTTADVPAQPEAITSSTLGTNLNICPPQEGIKFSVPAVPNATGYTWNLPSGWEITQGANTREITVKVNAAQTYTSPTSISVTANNVCGSGVERVLEEIGIDSFILTNAGNDLPVCKSLNPITIDAEVSFGNNQFDPTLKATGRDNNKGFVVNTKNGKVKGTFQYTYTPIAADSARGHVNITLSVPKPTGKNSSCGTGVDEMTITFKNIPTANIATPEAICIGTSTSLTITGTPNTKVTYKKSSGSNQTVNLNSSGNGTIDSGNLTENTVFQLVSIEYLNSPTCSTSLSSTTGTTVTITQKPTAVITYAGPYCKSSNSAQTPDLSGNYAYTGGTYTATGDLASKITASNGAFTPSTIAAGTYTVTYTMPSSGGCEAVTATTEVTITPPPTASISYGNSPFCSSDTADKLVTLSGTYAFTGGTYSATGGLDIDPSTGVIKAANSEPDTYTVTYTLPAAFGCNVVIATTEVTVTEIPVPTISYSSGAICQEDSNTFSPTITGEGVVTGGTFSAPAGLSITPAGVINPSQSTPGTYKINYTLQAAQGCDPVTTDTEVTITPVPSVEITYAGPFCESTTENKPVSFSASIGAFEGGTFNATPAGLTINTSSGAITPSSSAPGDYTVTYEIMASGGCGTEVATTEVSITPVPGATISYASAPFCSADNSIYQVSYSDTSGNFEGGTFSGSNGLDIDPVSGEITPGGSTLGNHTITYSIPTGEGCEAVTTTTQILIYQEVVINTQPFNIGTCSGEGIQFEVTAMGDGITYQWYKGTYPGTAISGATSSTYSINAVTSQDDGIYYIEISGTAPCAPVKSDEVTLNVDENIIIEVSPEDQNVCLNDNVTFYAEAIANGGEVTYQWRFNGNDIPNENGASLTLTNITASNLGDYSVFIEGPQGFTCSSIETSTASLSVFDPPTVNANNDFEVCSTLTSFEIGAGATASNHSSLIWTTNGQGQIFNALDLNAATYAPVAADFGNTLTFTLTAILEVDGIQLCEAAVDTKNITIIPQPVITEFSYISTDNTAVTGKFCETDAITNTPHIAGENLTNGTGVYSVDDSALEIDSSSGAFTPEGTPPGVYVVTYSYTVNSQEANCSIAEKIFTVTIGEKPVAEFTYGEVPFCSDADNISPTYLNDGIPGVFSSTNGLVFENTSTGEINISASTPGTYVITNTVDFSAEGCAIVTYSSSITISEKPVPDFTYSATDYCSDAENPIAQLSAGAVSGVFSEKNTNTGLQFIDTATGEIDLSGSEAGTYIIVNTVDVTEDGCEPVTAEFTVTIQQLPDATFNYSAAAFCQGSATNPTPTITGDPGGVFSASPGLVIDPSTGVIDVAASTANDSDNETETYTVTYSFPAANGCGPISEIINIRIDSTPAGGELIFAGLDRATYLVCHNATSGASRAMVLSGHLGKVIKWQKNDDPSDPNSWIDIPHTETSYSDYSGLTKTTIFRAVLSSGSCGVAYSKFAVISVIPADIKPDPVKSSATEICIGTEVQLTSELNYSSNTEIAKGGTFNSANPKGWLADGCKNCLDASNSNSKPSGFALSASNGTSYSGVSYTSDNKFAIAHSVDYSVLQTPIFSTFGLIDATLEFNHAYKLEDANASIRIEISTDGGITYDTANPLLFVQGPATLGPPNNFPEMNINLDDFVGRANLRIRFIFDGTANQNENSGSSWAIDNIAIPDRPLNVDSVWNYTNAQGESITINNQQNITVTPDKIGLNTFKITSFLVTDDGTECRSADPNNSETVEVYVFDKYTSTATINAGICGQNEFFLKGELEAQEQGTNISYPTPDGFSAPYWKVEGQTGYSFKNPDLNDTSNPLNNPNSIFIAPDEGTYTLSWVIERNVNDGRSVSACPPIVNSVTVIVKNCLDLDFDGIDDYVDIGEGYTGDYSIEAWIRPEASTGTIISTPKLEINMSDLSEFVTTNGRWYHIAVDSAGKLYVDGIDAEKTITATGTDRSFIGARWNAPKTENHFSGWIEEVRIWNGKISQKNIQFTMNQRLKATGNIGVEIDMEHPDAPVFGNLAGYYQLIATTILNGGYTQNLAGTVNGKLRNMETPQENTAPLPYFSADNGLWGTDETWARPNVWDPPNSLGIDGTPIEWNIVRTSHNIDSGNKNITLLGLISQSGTLDIFNPGNHNETNSGQYLRVSHYLKLDGIIDLTGESQLLQDVGSNIDAASTGYLQRDQQGTANSYNYNYWSFPVSTGVSNSGGTIKDLLRDGTTSNDPKIISFAYDHTYADNYNHGTGPKRISSYWLFKFFGTANVYAEWKWIGENGQLNTGDGFTMKGTSGSVPISTPQNYVFQGLPNNGPINSVSIGLNQNRLIGNPYPSALEAKQFILDNLDKDIVTGATNTENIFNGALYFWDHFGPINTHILREYVGGYATINLSGAVKAVSVDERINNNDDLKGSKEPGNFIPVGQGFFINTVLDPNISPDIVINGGTVNFNNSQRAFVTEADPGNSQFLKFIKLKKQAVKTEDSRYKIRLNFTSPLGYKRQILATADTNATNGFDLGYDALLLDDIAEDMFWVIKDNAFVIQAVPNFDIDQVLPLGIKIKESGEFNIQLETLKNAARQDFKVYLLDVLKDSIHDLRQAPYIETAEAGILKDRFKVIFYKEGTHAPELPEEPTLSGEELIGVVYVNNTAEIVIDNPHLFEINNVYLLNSVGQQVYMYYNIPKQKINKLPVKRFSSGIYIVKVYSEAGIVTKKVILE